MYVCIVKRHVMTVSVAIVLFAWLRMYGSDREQGYPLIGQKSASCFKEIYISMHMSVGNSYSVCHSHAYLYNRPRELLYCIFRSGVCQRPKMNSMSK